MIIYDSEYIANGVKKTIVVKDNTYEGAKRRIQEIEKGKDLHFISLKAKKEVKDNINNPSHYTQGIETYDYISSHAMSFPQGNVIKYVTRYKHKNGLEDLKKAQWYLSKLIKEMEGVK